MKYKLGYVGTKKICIMVKNYVHLTFIILSNVFVTKNSLTIFLLNDLRNFAGSFLKKSHEKRQKVLRFGRIFPEMFLLLFLHWFRKVYFLLFLNVLWFSFEEFILVVNLYIICQ